MKKVLYIFAGFNLLISLAGNAQKEDKATLINEVLKQKTGNARDLITDLYQVAIKNINSKDGEFTLKSTIYALMLSKDSLLAIDTSYTKKTFERNFELQLGLKSKEALQFTEGTFGFNYTFINNRDKSIGDFHSRLNLDEIISDLIANANFEVINSASFSSDQKKDIVKKTSEFLKSYDSKDLDSSYFRIIDKVVANDTSAKSKSISDLLQMRHKEYLQQEAIINSKALWNIGGKGVYDFENKLMNSVIANSEYLKGFTKNPDKKPVELDIKAEFNAEDDSTKAGQDISRMKLASSLGLNGVLVQNAAKQSIMELKLFASHDGIFQGSYNGEEKNIFAANLTFRVKISESTWIPVTIKYDVTNDNFFGFLNVTWNLEKVSD